MTPPLAPRLVRAFTDNVAETRPHHDDPRLRGRTYTVPFERVWQEAVHLAAGGLRRWRIVEADDRRGLIHAEATIPVFQWVDDVFIRVRLDDDAQTRVDARSASLKGRADLGVNARRLAAFFRALDARLAREP